MPAKPVTTSADVDALVAELFDPARTQPVVVVTTRMGEEAPLIDADAVAQALADDGLVVRLIQTGPLTWELTGQLPDRLGVFGGAARIWWPGLTRDDAPHRHPLIFAYTADEGARAVRRLRDELGAGASRAPARVTVAPPAAAPQDLLLPVGAVIVGVVTDALAGGAEVDVGAGLTGWLVRRRRDAALEVGDRVEVRISGYQAGAPLLERPPRQPAERSQARSLLAADGGPGAGQPVRPGPHLLASRAAPPVAQQQAVRVESAREELADVKRALVDAHAELQRVRRLLGEVEEERLAAERRAEEAELEAGRAIRGSARSEREVKAQLRRARDRMQWLEDQLRGAGRYDEPEAQFRHEVETAWKRTHQWDGDPPRLADYRLGPDFLPSLQRVEGISRSKIVEVCVEVLTGRAETKASRELHPLRSDEGADSTQRVRQDDGAKAWRASLQIKTPSARRLHFWRLPGGEVELANVVQHDDFTIA